MGDDGRRLVAAQGSALYRLPRWLISVLLKNIWGLKIVGLESVPKEGPVIVAANHVSWLDGVVISVAVSSVRPIAHLGKKELFRIPLLGAYMRKMGMIPLERKGDPVAMKTAVEFLRHGGCLGIFPEGTRSKGGGPGTPKAGVGFLAGQSNATVAPALLVGTTRFPRFGPLEIRFGTPLWFTGDPADHAQCLAFAQDVMKKVFALQ